MSYILSLQLASEPSFAFLAWCLAFEAILISESVCAAVFGLVDC